jgi:hypothetical protein
MADRTTTMLPAAGEISDIAHEALHHDADAQRFYYLLASSPATAGSGVEPSVYSTRPPPPNE